MRLRDAQKASYIIYEKGDESREQIAFTVLKKMRRELSKEARELQDTKDAFGILKNYRYSGTMTQALFIETVKARRRIREEGTV